MTIHPIELILLALSSAIISSHFQPKAFWPTWAATFAIGAASSMLFNASKRRP